MLAVDQPPLVPASSAEERLISADARFVTATASDIPVVLARGRPAQTERGWARYQIYIKSEATGYAVGPNQECRWKLTAFVQRTLCFASMTGQFGCTAPAMTELADKADGFEVTADKDEVCNTGHPAIMRAERRFTNSLTVAANARFESDFKLSLIPTLAKTGVTVTRPAAAGR